MVFWGIESSNTKHIINILLLMIQFLSLSHSLPIPFIYQAQLFFLSLNRRPGHMFTTMLVLMSFGIQLLHPSHCTFLPSVSKSLIRTPLFCLFTYSHSTSFMEFSFILGQGFIHIDTFHSLVMLLSTWVKYQ